MAIYKRRKKSVSKKARRSSKAMPGGSKKSRARARR